MRELNNPHDKFFKELMSDNFRAKELLRAFLPKTLSKHLDFETIEKQDGTFVSKDLLEYITDTIFRIKLKGGEDCYLSVLLEHKSYKDEHVHLQLLAYLGNAYHRQIRNKEPLTLILPVIYYHGKDSWELKGIGHLFEKYPTSFHKYLPKFDLELIDLASLSDDELIGVAGELLSSPLLLQKYACNPNELSKRIVRILSTINPHLKKSFLTNIFVYSTQLIQLKEEEVAEVINKLPNSIRQTVMTTYEILLEKGRKEGLEKGLEEGLEKGLLRTIENCFKEDFSIEIASKISGTSVKKVEEIYNRLSK